MSSEKNMQPGGRNPAPGELGTLQAFLNTRWSLGSANHGETFTDPGTFRDWLADRALVPAGAKLTNADRERAFDVRESLRTLAFANNGRHADQAVFKTLERASRRATTRVRIDADGPRFLPGGGPAGDAALGALLAIAAQAMTEGSWARLKACPGRDCGWVFYDASRNGSARWCSMKVCGDREKARAYYRRRRP